jgi:hypothetical protein
MFLSSAFKGLLLFRYLCGPQARACDIEVCQIQAYLKFKLVVVGRHIGAKLVKSFVVFALFAVGKFMNRDHLQKFGRCVLEHRGDADLALGFELVALHARDGGVRAQRMGQGLQFSI